ncbi:MAG TPA: glycosyltransferase, partial [Solirubrobacteraceae bacterium]|nr:glycosyltransferase [Solirubrobacteraceae bacterium]
MSAADEHEQPGLLCVSRSFAPETTPTGIRAGKLLKRLAGRWHVTLLTEAHGAQSSDRLRVCTVASRRPTRLLAALRRLRMDKLLELAIWPDDAIFWVLPAILAGRRLIRDRRPKAILVFMMPYSSGLVGLALARMSGLPLILNLDDSPTCSDMHPDFPSRLHYRLARWLEDLYARRADAIVYVSQTNLELVRARQTTENGEKFHLVRYGADARDFQPLPQDTGRFEIVYVGAMSGWWTLIKRQAPPPGALKRIYDAWLRLGRHRLTELDTLTASPAIVGQALLGALTEHPEWQGRVGMTVYDSSYPRELVTRALAAGSIEQVVAVHDAVAHEQVAEILGRADLLFLTLPRRVDGSRGGRISAKTYEYLMTDRPILAALPPGENRDYLHDRPGVWLTAPDDVEGMRKAIVELAGAKLAG